jgi:hypothetical protein
MYYIHLYYERVWFYVVYINSNETVRIVRTVSTKFNVGTEIYHEVE